MTGDILSLVSLIQAAQRAVEQTWFQAYLFVEFCGSSWSWGRLRWRYAMSGAQDGEWDFGSWNELVKALEDIVLPRYASAHTIERGNPGEAYHAFIAELRRWRQLPAA